MAIMEWVHTAWNGCIIGNSGEAGQPASELLYERKNVTTQEF